MTQCDIGYEGDGTRAAETYDESRAAATAQRENCGECCLAQTPSQETEAVVAKRREAGRDGALTQRSGNAKAKKGHLGRKRQILLCGVRQLWQGLHEGVSGLDLRNRVEAERILWL